jgi:hypothetical protein
LAEGVGTLGFFLGVLGKSKFDLYFLLLISGAAMLYYRPKQEELVEILKQEQTLKDRDRS